MNDKELSEGPELWELENRSDEYGGKRLKEKKDVSLSRKASVWMILSNGDLSPAWGSVESLTAGIYDVFKDNNGNLLFRAVGIDTVGLFEFTGSTADAILKEVEDFWRSEAKYKKLQYPYKRGIILHGKPGCGKTVTVKLISKEIIERNGIVIHSEDIIAIAESLDALEEIEPKRPVVVILEEIDMIISKYGKVLTELLDGVKARKKNVLFVATTNSLSDLPDRIKDRPSRFDTIAKIATPTEEARYEYTYHITKNKKFPTEVAKKTDGLTFAHLKEVVIGCKVFNKDLDTSVKKFEKQEEVGFKKPKEKAGF